VTQLLIKVFTLPFYYIINIRSLLFNLYYLKFSEAIRLPILVSSNVYMKTQKGSITINSPISRGMVKLGYGEIGIRDRNNSRSIWHCYGNVIFNGPATINQGFILNINPGGKLEFGNGFTMIAASTIICNKSIKFGDNCLLSWDVQIMDSDLHKIFDANDKRINENKEIIIGSKVWIGSKVVILKGVNLKDNTIVAAGSVVTRSFQNNSIIIAGNPAREIKSGIHWKL